MVVKTRCPVKAALIAISTVSRAFNQQESINHQTKEKILKISKELKYTPNITAQKLSGAKILLKSLLQEKVEVIFGIPGGAVLPIYDEIYKCEQNRQIKHILMRHEQGAAHAADGYARISGKVGVCIATSGPGATNLVTGIATAMLDSVPMVAITGNVPSYLLGRDAFQETDIIGVTQSPAEK